MPDSIEDQIERILRADLVQRDTGLQEALRRSEQAGEAVFLFGGDSATIHALRRRLRSRRPRLRLAGVCDADFSGPAGPGILAHIAACKPDLVIADLAPRRHRALIAEFAAHGLHIGLVNLPGTFARYLATQPGAAGLARLTAKLPPAIGRAFGELAGLARLSGILARQLLQRAAPAAGAGRAGAPRLPGRRLRSNAL
ncbi:WecB/TagA/CpsF family glycosyltransferase [Bosea minatitlanensis]|uniref:WecB/TagA/CpsF family glycosyltransferase n=1 Tax=Bosea minatitlanensis TaxID=128782 RepID=A0ABW0EYU6_9HYPH|nr:WecB/TagA/CpsF family glycosyltransferase [Bosea minatitlanensis]MCT4491723.1 WecB/TagA/CpsF family glycosyltransferase [Bosea minatitlanensis]